MEFWSLQYPWVSNSATSNCLTTNQTYDIHHEHVNIWHELRHQIWFQNYHHQYWLWEYKIISILTSSYHNNVDLVPLHWNRKSHQVDRLTPHWRHWRQASAPQVQPWQSRWWPLCVHVRWLIYCLLDTYKAAVWIEWDWKSYIWIMAMCSISLHHEFSYYIFWCQV